MPLAAGHRARRQRASAWLDRTQEPGGRERATVWTAWGFGKAIALGLGLRRDWGSPTEATRFTSTPPKPPPYSGTGRGTILTSTRSRKGSPAPAAAALSGFRQGVASVMSTV